MDSRRVGFLWISPTFAARDLSWPSQVLATRFAPHRRHCSLRRVLERWRIRARIFAIGCSYGDADDLDFLRSDPAFKLACGRLPDTGRDLASQPTLSRLESAPALRDVIRLTYALIDQWMASYDEPPFSVTLDIDDTCDIAHGH